MKQLLVLTLALFGFALAHAEEDGPMRGPTKAEAMSILGDQLLKLQKQTAPSCPQNYKSFAKEKDLRVGFFYGYENFENITVDEVSARAFAATLQKKCTANVAVCEFKATARTRDSIRLEREVNGKPVVVSIYWTSVTDNDVINMDPNGGYWQQEAHSRAIKDKFFKALRVNDVVFYSGHSRHGGGPGFDAVSPISIGVNMLLRLPLKPMLSALEQRPSRLKILGLFSCDSARYYRDDILRANPNVSQILSHDEIDSDEGEQIELGALNSILLQKCERDFASSMVSVSAPKHRVMQFLRRN